MINRAQLLADLQAVLRKLEADLLERGEEMPEVSTALTGEHQRARKADRTAQSFEDWRSDYITQIAAAWVLSCVFVRFLEDNRLIDPPKIAGPDERLARARDEHELYFRTHPTETDREYLLHVFGKLARLPGVKDIFGEHNPIHELPNWLSGDAAGELLSFFERIDANTGVLVHDFTDPDWNTRFLGDLYQDLSQAARKKFALLQTPEFVEEFILDRTLDPAIDEFGLEGFRMIDPACGSGHFLLGSFTRLLNCWLRKEPGANIRALAQRALESIHGVDVNPYAIAIARFRLLLAAMKACDLRRLADIPAFHLNLACGDSLIHGSGKAVQQYLGDWDPIEHVYQSEDLPDLQHILQPGRYHAVVANPPYIVPSDQSLSNAYRARYSVCYRQYSLGAPFMQRIFNLCVNGGYCGQITANSFMNNEYGKRLITEFIPQIDLTHIIDCSGAAIPGHNTPTVILFGRNRKPVQPTIRTVLGIRGEPPGINIIPGRVWSAIVSQVDCPSSTSKFVSVHDLSRQQFYDHPWTIVGGSAPELLKRIESGAVARLGNLVKAIGRTTVVGEDDVWIFDRATALRRRYSKQCMPLAMGEYIRDWIVIDLPVAIYPYESLGGKPIPKDDFIVQHHLWLYRTTLQQRTVFGKSLSDMSRPWWEHLEHYRDKFHPKPSIVFAFKATHNHFVYDTGNKLYKQTAPVIKLKDAAQEADYMGLIGLLNSSTAGFWERQVHRSTGGYAYGKWQERLERNAAKIKEFPIPSRQPVELAKKLYHLSHELLERSPSTLTRRKELLTKRFWVEERQCWESLLSQMIAQQEELDWQCYRLYNLIGEPLTYDKDPPPIKLGQRAFEIVMARKMIAGELETTWFKRHNSIPVTEIPIEWPEDYRQLIERRIALIQTDHSIGRIEQPEYKRRWSPEPWESQQERALRNWLLDRLEACFDFDGRMNDADTPTAKIDVSLVSTTRLADLARQDADFMQVGELYRDNQAFDVNRLVAELVEAESIPLLPVLRYKPSGLRKRKVWEQTWDLQRREDTIDARMKLPEDDPQYLTELQAQDLKRRKIGDIPVPPKYTSSDFQSSTYWRLRGKLDVPKERWVCFPHCEGADGTLMIAWAGYDHLQLARAISTYYVDIQERLGGRDDPRLVPLLACLIELLPWLKQWHNEVDPEFGMHMGDYFEGFIQEEARQMGKTLDQIRAWEPPKKTTHRRKQAAMES